MAVKQLFILLFVVSALAAAAASAKVSSPVSAWSEAGLFNKATNASFDSEITDPAAIVSLFNDGDSSLKNPQCVRKEVARAFAHRSGPELNIKNIQVVEALGKYCDVTSPMGVWYSLRKTQFYKINLVDENGKTDSVWASCQTSSRDFAFAGPCGIIGGKL